MSAESSDTSSYEVFRRRAHFRMSDGSPSFYDWQRHDESQEDFANRMAIEITNGGGYVSLAGVELHQITDDPDTEAMINEAAAGHPA